MNDIDHIVRNYRALERSMGRIDSLARSITRKSSLERSLNVLNLGRISHVINQTEEAMRIYLGPLNEMLRQSEKSSALVQLNNLANEIESRFRSLQVDETLQLMHDLDKQYLARLESHYKVEMSILQQTVNSMHTKWLDSLAMENSIQGFLSLQAIGHGLRNIPPFDTDFTGALRLDLGDWREELKVADSVLLDPQQRTSFYDTQGLNPRLTVFPADAFEQAIAVAGILGPPPPIVSEYDQSPIFENDESEEGLLRTNRAHAWLHRFETQVRSFIDRVMTQEIGATWIKQRLPNEIREQWVERQQKDTGETTWPLIAYADFSDYATIICRNDNWREVFAKVFKNKDSIQESFHRLYPIRLCTMHARVITQDDELYLHAETKRILKAIGISV